MPLLVNIERNIATIALSRPESRNAWDEDFNEGLSTTLQQFAEDPEVRCVILTGDPAGNAFSAGANLKDPSIHQLGRPGEFIEGLPKWRQFVTHLLSEFPKPIIGAINGYAIGIGCIAAFSCDLIIASERAQWRLPQVRLGILPTYGGSARIGKWMGRGQIMKLALGFPLDAQEAYRIGAAQWLTPHDDLMQEAARIAACITELPPLAVRLVKESVLQSTNSASIADVAVTDLYRFMVLEQTDDSREAHQAWRDGRPPLVRGS